MKEIYIKAEDEIIDKILDIVRGLIGKEVRIVDLNPKLQEDTNE